MFATNNPKVPSTPWQDRLGVRWHPDTSLSPRTLEMLAGDPLLSEDPEPDKTPTATAVSGE